MIGLLQRVFGWIAIGASLWTVVGLVNKITGRTEQLGFPDTAFASFEVAVASIVICLLCEIAGRLPPRGKDAP